MAFYEVFVDGAARGQGVVGKTGHGSAACVIFKNKQHVGQYARGLGMVTNNQAEYEAVLLGALMCWAAQVDHPTIYSDAALVVKQINGEWKCKSDDLLPLYYSIMEIKEVYPFRLVQVKRKNVAVADHLANKMLDQMLEKPGKISKFSTEANIDE